MSDRQREEPTSCTEKAAEHLRSPRNVGSLNRVDSLVGTGVAELPGRGDTIRLQIRIDAASGAVAESRFKAFGCAWIIACGSRITEWAQGRTLDELLAVEPAMIAGDLDLPGDKSYCADLAVAALAAAAADYRQRNANGRCGEAPLR